MKIKDKSNHTITHEEYSKLYNQFENYGKYPDYVASRVFDLTITVMKLSKRLDEIEPCKKICCKDLSKRNKKK